MTLALVTHEGVPLSDLVSQQPEVGTTEEPTPLEDLWRVAAQEAEKQSTKVG